jgi:TolA-binding protein
MEAGELYFKGKNYKGSELRFRDALDYKPDQPDATFRLAETLDRLGKNDETQTTYQAYLRIQPNGTYGEKARIALQRLGKKSARKD